MTAKITASIIKFFLKDLIFSERIKHKTNTITSIDRIKNITDNHPFYVHLYRQTLKTMINYRILLLKLRLFQ